MHTIFELEKTQQETVSLEEINNQRVTVLPKREELSVINYNIGYPYMGYDGQHPNYYQVDNHTNGNNDYQRWDCYRYEGNHDKPQHDPAYWRYHEGANDRNITYDNRHDNGLHLGHYKHDGYAPVVSYNTYYPATPEYSHNPPMTNTYAGYGNYNGNSAYGYNPGYNAYSAYSGGYPYYGRYNA
jgi:hypothetical protein